MYVHFHVHEPAFGCGCVYRAGTQSLHVGVPVVAYIHTEFTCGCK